ncbi:MAG: iron-sulfur cluster-binding protein [Deltaproteobacteria bacterium]|nr:iron-sulfur cluster-binding protein [Deltaproteobacteria bacterium]
MRENRFRKRYQAALNDAQLQKGVSAATRLLVSMREKTVAEIPDWQALRERGRAIREHTLDHLDGCLETLEQSVTRQGGHVFWAKDDEAARRYVLDLALSRGVKTIVKGKSMISEEIGLNDALEAHGVEPVETDLGEFIVQLADEHPSHILAPAIHKTKEDISLLFARKLLKPKVTEPKALMAQAREHLRGKFLEAQMGVTGANFAVARTGTVVLTENEGNIRFSTTCPPVHVSIMSLEKVVPDWSELYVLLNLLIISATGQRLSTYVSFLNPPMADKTRHGPKEFHLVLLDNGRSRILGDERYRSILRCIRCAACFNVCPVYTKIGGHAYGTVYPGPMGSVLSPLLFGLDAHEELPFASTLCGACRDVCPVKIDIPNMLLELRSDVTENWKARHRMYGRRLRVEVWSRVAGDETVLRWASRIARSAEPILNVAKAPDGFKLSHRRFERSE